MFELLSALDSHVERGHQKPLCASIWALFDLPTRVAAVDPSNPKTATRLIGGLPATLAKIHFICTYLFQVALPDHSNERCQCLSPAGSLDRSHPPNRGEGFPFEGIPCVGNTFRGEYQTNRGTPFLGARTPALTPIARWFLCGFSH